MNEKFKCPACYRKYYLHETNVCPSCGQTPQEARGEAPVKEVSVSIPSPRDSSDRKSSSKNSDAGVSAKVLPSISKRAESSKPIASASSKGATDPLVEAVNRATRAIRSIAVFFFTSMTTGLIGIPLLWFGMVRESTELVAAGALICFTGFVTAFVAGFIELRASRF